MRWKATQDPEAVTIEVVTLCQMTINDQRVQWSISLMSEKKD